MTRDELRDVIYLAVQYRRAPVCARYGHAHEGGLARRLDGARSRTLVGACARCGSPIEEAFELRDVR